jgi:hypothetical protein
MEGILSSETSVLTRATRRHIPEDDILHSDRLTSYSVVKINFNIIILHLPKSSNWSLSTRILQVSPVSYMRPLCSRITTAWRVLALREEGRTGEVEDRKWRCCDFRVERWARNSSLQNVILLMKCYKEPRTWRFRNFGCQYRILYETVISLTTLKT